MIIPYQFHFNIIAISNLRGEKWENIKEKFSTIHKITSMGIIFGLLNVPTTNNNNIMSKVGRDYAAKL